MTYGSGSKCKGPHAGRRGDMQQRAEAVGEVIHVGLEVIHELSATPGVCAYPTQPCSATQYRERKRAASTVFSACGDTE